MPKQFQTGRRRLEIAVLGIAFAFAVTLVVAESSWFYFWQQKRMVDRVLASDPNELLSATRELTRSPPSYPEWITESMIEIHPVLKRLGAKRVVIQTNFVAVGFGDVFNPFGILAVLDEGTPVPYTYRLAYRRKWIPGLWIYHDGQVSSKEEQDAPPNTASPRR